MTHSSVFAAPERAAVPPYSTQRPVSCHVSRFVLCPVRADACLTSFLTRRDQITGTRTTKPGAAPDDSRDQNRRARRCRLGSRRQIATLQPGRDREALATALGGGRSVRRLHRLRPA